MRFRAIIPRRGVALLYWRGNNNWTIRFETQTKWGIRRKVLKEQPDSYVNKLMNNVVVLYEED